MIVGVPKEIKDLENRVSTTPAGVGELTHHGHDVVVERGAGAGSGFTDQEYAAAGASLAGSHGEVFAAADMIVKVKEPVASEYDLLRADQLLFTYLHLAADEPLTRALQRNRVAAIAYETVQLQSSVLPLLTPMSEVAGRMSIQVGAHWLERTQGGRGMLLGGVPGVPGANVVGHRRRCRRHQRCRDRPRHGRQRDNHRPQRRAAALPRACAARPHPHRGLDQAGDRSGGRDGDLVIGGVLIAGAKAPKLVTKEMIGSMNPGAVVVDVAIDQGGCIETAKPTSHSDPVYNVEGVIHYCVTNMPGAVPRTSTFALANVTLPYALELADLGLTGAIQRDPALAKGVNVLDGRITYKAVADAFDLEYTPLEEILDQTVAA